MSYASIIQKLPPDLQFTILELVESVEQNMRDQLAVRREDFDGLRAEVHEVREAQAYTIQRVDRLEVAIVELTEAQTRTEDRLDRVESALVRLAEAQQRTEERLSALAEAQQRTEERLNALAEAQQRTEERLNALAEAQQHTEERLSALAEAQLRIEARMERVEDALVRLTAAQEQTQTILADLARQQVQMQVRQDEHTGMFLENNYRNRPHSYFGAMLRKARVVSFLELEDQLEQRLAEPDVNELARLDLIVRGRPKHPADAPDVWLAVEVSATVDRNDVERARRRAAILRRAGFVAVPVAAGKAVTQGGVEQAQADQVALVQNGSVELWEEALAAALSE